MMIIINLKHCNFLISYYNNPTDYPEKVMVYLMKTIFGGRIPIISGFWSYFTYK